MSSILIDIISSVWYLKFFKVFFSLVSILDSAVSILIVACRSYPKEPGLQGIHNGR